MIHPSPNKNLPTANAGWHSVSWPMMTRLKTVKVPPPGMLVLSDTPSTTRQDPRNQSGSTSGYRPVREGTIASELVHSTSITTMKRTVMTPKSSFLSPVLVMLTTSSGGQDRSPSSEMGTRSSQTPPVWRERQFPSFTSLVKHAGGTPHHGAEGGKCHTSYVSWDRYIPCPSVCYHGPPCIVLLVYPQANQ